MLYRRKVLLALLNEFGGSLINTDCQKILFLYCDRFGKNYYDFYPYKFGAFSQVLYDDKRQLIRLGWLKKHNDYVLEHSRSGDMGLQNTDKSAIVELKREIRWVRGKKLVRKVYLEFPRFASNSEIVSNILSPLELSRVKRFWKKDNSNCLITIGYEGKSIDYYLNQLVENNVKVLIDVRRNPISRKFGFSKTKLSKYVNNLGIRYIHMPELGISSKLRKKLNDKNAYDQLFEYYRNHILPEQENSIKKIREILEENHRIALTCFEADHTNCHRHIITDALMSQKKQISQIQHLA